jgi:hypothetical protein
MTSTDQVEVHPVQTPQALEEFLRFPWRLYEHDPYWVPPLLPLQRNFLDPARGPFFEIGEAQYFLAYWRGRPAGRISAHLNRAYDQYHDTITGFFGFFECIPEPMVANALFEAAAHWLRRHGKQRLVGPLNFSVYDEMGLLVEGFDSMPAIFQTHNPPYYQEILADLAFHKVLDWYALRITDRNVNLEAMQNHLDTIMGKQPLVLRTLRRGELNHRAAEVYDLFNEAWSPNWGHVPLSQGQFDKLFQELQPLLRPELVNLVLDGDHLVAFSITIPDLNPLVRRLNGRFSLWDQLRLLYAAKFGPLKKARALVLGVHQPYQARRLHYAMVLKTYLHILRNTPCEACDLSLVPENLRSYLKALKSLGAQHYKTFRVFEKAI